MFEIYKTDVEPVGARNLSAPRTSKYPFRQMEVGDWFFVPGKDKNTLSTNTSSAGKRLGMKFETKLTFMSNATGGWEPCPFHADGATKGIYVKRIA